MAKRVVFCLVENSRDEVLLIRAWVWKREGKVVVAWWICGPRRK